MTPLKKRLETKEELRKKFIEGDKVKEKKKIDGPEKDFTKMLQKANDRDEKLSSVFKAEITNKQSGKEQLRKQFEPVIEGLKQIKQAVTTVDEDIKSQSVALMSKPESIIPPETPTRPVIKEPATPTVEIKDITQPTPTSRLTKEELLHKDIIGERPYYYMSKSLDPVFGIYYDVNNFEFKIGNSRVNFGPENNIFSVAGKEFKITDGLLRFLTYRDYIESNYYSEIDLKNYAKILYLTDSIYQTNNKSSKKIKTGKGSKYTKLVFHIWSFMKNCSPEIIDEFINDYYKTNTKAGSGIVLNSNPIEYKYIEIISQLLQRLYFILAEEKAGNNSFHNEKLGILKLSMNQMKKLIDVLLMFYPKELSAQE
ncbi:hypothetical protein Zmor_006008 [Zophobas morio]|uniref:DUF8207 domain-containing protein n=1 Tax=Zophobas morio TaxID=2755281 RepID=A0AA38IR03_9CUCU|nr:hypothetical protein Zmor_006008 [Zophobas morio]